MRVGKAHDHTADGVSLQGKPTRRTRIKYPNRSGTFRKEDFH